MNTIIFRFILVMFLVVFLVPGVKAGGYAYYQNGQVYNGGNGYYYQVPAATNNSYVYENRYGNYPQPNNYYYPAGTYYQPYYQNNAGYPVDNDSDYYYYYHNRAPYTEDGYNGYSDNDSDYYPGNVYNRYDQEDDNYGYKGEKKHSSRVDILSSSDYPLYFED